MLMMAWRLWELYFGLFAIFGLLLMMTEFVDEALSGA